MAKTNQSLELRIHEVINQAVSEAVAAFRDNIVAEVHRGLGSDGGLAGAARSERGPARIAGRRAATGGPGKRAWPICSVPGCGKKFFGPSGSARFCYEHYVQSGGQHPARLAAPGKRGRAAKARSPRALRSSPARRGQAAGVPGALVDQLLAFISRNPGLRSEQIQKQLGAKQAAVKVGLAKLRASGRVKTSGTRRATTYASA